MRILSTPFCLPTMMLYLTGYNRPVYRRATNWRIFVLCILSLMHTLNCNNSECIGGVCDKDVIQLLKLEKRTNLQHRENELMQKQKQIQVELQKLYVEKSQLELMLNEENTQTSDLNLGLEYEIPSYCANCVGDSLKMASTGSLSSEYARKNAAKSYAAEENEIPRLSDKSRLESIKFQILLKLGLENKPNVTFPLPKQFIVDTLSRSGDTMMNYIMELQSETKDSHDSRLDQFQPQINNESYAESHAAKDLNELPMDDDQELDDFYGRTREIITFAERGEI